MLTLTLASCAKKAPNVPVAPGAARFADFVFPTAAAGLAPPAPRAPRRAAWQVLQSGDAKAAERDFGTILKQVPAF